MIKRRTIIKSNAWCEPLHLQILKWFMDMLILLAGIVGLVLGFFVSSNPTVGIICGGVIALIAWAITGFNTQYKIPDNDAKSTHQDVEITGSSFTFNAPELGLGALTPQQFGASFVVQSWPRAESLVDILFANPKHGAKLPVKRNVTDEPLAAHLFLTSMLIASYFVYPITFLKVDKATLGEIMEGAVGELAGLRKADGLLVGREDIQQVKELVSSFYDFMMDDLGYVDQNVGKNPNDKPPKATELLITLIVSHYNNGGATGHVAVERLKHQGFYHADYVSATKIIDESAHAAFKSLENANARWIPA